MKSVQNTPNSTAWKKDCSDKIPDIAAAYDVQDHVMAERSAKRGGLAGYKISFNSPALMQKMKISEPGAGRIVADQVLTAALRWMSRVTAIP